MKIAAWNLNHRASAKTMPAAVLDVTRAIAPDVLVLTEYVDAESRSEFKAAPGEQGFSRLSVSKKVPGHNQVLVASRAQHLRGALPPPTCDSHAETNFLSVQVGALEVVGLRAPMYKTRRETERYWSELQGCARGASNRPVLLIGDMNGDPADPRSPGGVRMAQWRSGGWVIPVASGAWSFATGDGVRGSRIDHVIATAGVGEIDASYVTRVGSHVLAGGRSEAPLSDHAMLVAVLKSFDGAGMKTSGPRSEIVLHVAAEGGGLDLVGCRKGGGWVFRRAVRDWTPELLGDEWVEHESGGVGTWGEALELLDTYPWHELSPTFVHPEFRQAVFDAVLERYGARASARGSTFGKWKWLCGGAEE